MSQKAWMVDTKVPTCRAIMIELIDLFNPCKCLYTFAYAVYVFFATIRCRKWFLEWEMKSKFLLFSGICQVFSGKHLFDCLLYCWIIFLSLSLPFAFVSICWVICDTFDRMYGSWVARNPAFVLFSSLAVVLVLSLGLIRFEVETRPEKVLRWHLYNPTPKICFRDLSLHCFDLWILNFFVH